MKKYLIYLIFPLIIMYTLYSNSSVLNINKSRLNYYGGKITKAADYLITRSNREKTLVDGYNNIDSYQMIENIQEATDHTKKISEYRFVGIQANNYIYFNCTSDDYSSCELWRIIGVFDVEDNYQNHDYKIKIMKDDSIGKMSFDDNLNDYESSNIKNYLNNDYYNSLSDSAKKMISISKFYTSGNSLSNYNGELLYNSERGKSTNKSVDFIGNIGLIYPSDYLYSYYMVNDNCYSNLGYCDNKYDSWMYKISNNQFWTITPLANTNYLYTISNNSSIDKSVYSDNLDVYPTVYLNYDTIIYEGNGTKAYPYRIRSMNNSEIQKENDMLKDGLDKSYVNVSDTLSTKSIVIIFVGVLLVFGGLIYIFVLRNRKNIRK